MEFQLNAGFVDKYKSIKPDFGFNGVGLFTYYRTYSRLKPDGTNEQWFETVERVVNSIYSIQKTHIEKEQLGWNERKAQRSAQEMYDRIFNMKFLPAGRMLWALGTDIIHNRKVGQALFNCAFVSTKDIGKSTKEAVKPFTFMMDMSMVGVGVGFDVLGEGSITIKKPKESIAHTIPDSREGWVKSLELLLAAYFNGEPLPQFDYSEIRGPGLPIKGFGGISSGSEPLKKLHLDVEALLEKSVGTPITQRIIADIMNMIGVCVIAGNVRRCLPEGTLVHTESGLKPIEDVEVGEKVYTSKGLYKVSENVYQGEQELVEIHTELCVLKCTAKHKIAVLTSFGSYDWKQAQELVEGDNLVKVNNIETVPYLEPIPFIKLKYKGEKAKTYDLSVPVANEFLVENGLLVHNTAQIMLGNDNSEYLKLKDYRWDNSAGKYVGEAVDRASWGWASNNSVLVNEFSDFKKLGQQTTVNGEPGYVFLENMKKYSRMMDSPDWKDGKVVGTNPCFTEDTLVHTKNGHFQIKDLVGKTVEVHDGNEWVKIDNFRVTGKYQQILAITLYDGSVIKATPYHTFLLEDGSKIEAKNLKEEDALMISSISNKTQKQWNRILSIKDAGIADKVYCCTVPTNNTFSLSCGIRTGQCGEQSLEHFELCNLVEVFPSRCESKEDFLRTLKFSYLVAKTVTLVPTTWSETNRVQKRNRRIGNSISGVASFLEGNSVETLRSWLVDGYSELSKWDKIYSAWFCIPESIKKTSIKPSGTISLLAGVTPGAHFAEFNYYTRRIRIAKSSPLVQYAIKAGYHVEPDIMDSNNTMVVSFPVHVKGRTVKDASIWEKVIVANFLQKYWADNQVSCTVTFTKEEASQIPIILEWLNYDMKAISFLPMLEHGAYAQMPYEAITEEKYNEMVSKIDFGVPIVIKGNEADQVEKFCSNDTCEIQ